MRPINRGADSDWVSPQKCGRQPLWLLHPAGSTAGRHQQENWLAHFSAYVLDFDQVAGHRCQSRPGTPAACIFQNNDRRLYAGFGSTEMSSTGSFGGPDHAHG